MIRKGFLPVFFTGLVSGLITGIILWNLLLAIRIDNLYERNKYLEGMVEDYRVKLEKLEQSRPEKEITLKGITVQIDIEDEIEKMVLEQAVKQKYDVLFGKKISEIDLELVVRVVDKRIFVTEKYQYQLTVNRVILSSTLSLYISAMELSLD